MHEVVQKVLEKSGFGELNPVQTKAVNAGLLEKNNMVIAAPTASGKTLVAEIAALETIKENKKVVYIVPLRALATEKYQEFKEKYEPLGIRIAISIGDLDSSDPWLANYDLIIVTSEKLDSLLRHGINWVESIGLVVADEIHLLNDPGRGPTLEVVLTRLRQFADPKILALSATINNYKELSEWLEAKSVKSDYRPVKLYRGICFDNRIDFIPKKSLKLNPEEANLKELIEHVLAKKKQALVFISTRRGAESAAEKIAKTVKGKLTPEEKKKLNKVSEKILGVLGHPTVQCHRVSGCVRDGVAFHHAGLTNKQRNLIEDAFKSGLIKAITATPTLAAGINLPAWRVIVKDLKRFDSGRGMDYIPVLEIQQMMGRAGRPKYDSEGEAILLTNNKKDAGYAWDNYIRGEPENIYSKLGMEPVLRTHVLSLIASGVTPTKEELFNFFSKTFYAHQYKDMGNIKKILDKIISMLEEFRFITTGRKKEEGPFKSGTSLLEEEKAELKPTRIGKRISELYIDPLTANHLIGGLGIAKERGVNDFACLHMISNTLEMMPLPNIRKSDMEGLNEIVVKEEKNLIQKPPNPWDIEYDDFLRSLKNAWLLMVWCDEAGEDKILDRFSVTPGELRVRLNNADWLLYATQELGLLLGYMEILKDIRKTRLRVKYGVRKELLPLVRLKGIGRVKARLLYNSGLRSLDSLRKIPLASLERIIGPKTARQVKNQLE
ncbi:MAG: DEAD/DEAH box helicase [Candidatus Aenigmarchaeota archaeon]|nr:DEAD/DEAH box helicase [Candidatus Aenigmarchaeota archaeon]